MQTQWNSLIDDISVASLSPLKNILLARGVPSSVAAAAASKNTNSNSNSHSGEGGMFLSPTYQRAVQSATQALFTKSDTDEPRPMPAPTQRNTYAAGPANDFDDDPLNAVSASPSPPNYAMQNKHLRSSRAAIDDDDGDLSPMSAQRQSRASMSAAAAATAATATSSATLAGHRVAGRVRAAAGPAGGAAVAAAASGAAPLGFYAPSCVSGADRTSHLLSTASSRPAIQSLFRHFGGRLRFAHMPQVLRCASLPCDTAACDAVWFELVSGMAVPYVSEARFVELLEEKGAVVVHPSEWPEGAEVAASTPTPQRGQQAQQQQQQQQERSGSRRRGEENGDAAEQAALNAKKKQHHFDAAVPMLKDASAVPAAALAASPSGSATKKKVGRTTTAAFAPRTTTPRTPSPSSRSSGGGTPTRRDSPASLKQPVAAARSSKSAAQPAAPASAAPVARNAAANCPFGIVSAGDRPPMFPTSASTSAPAPALCVGADDNDEHNTLQSSSAPDSALNTHRSSKRSSPSPVPPLYGNSEPTHFTHLYGPQAAEYTEPFDRGDMSGHGGRSNNVLSPEKESPAPPPLPAASSAALPPVAAVPAALKPRNDNAAATAATKDAAALSRKASTSSTARRPSLRERSSDRAAQQRAEEKRAKIAAELEQSRTAQCTFRPAVNTRSNRLVASARTRAASSTSSASSAIAHVRSATAASSSSSTAAVAAAVATPDARVPSSASQRSHSASQHRVSSVSPARPVTSVPRTQSASHNGSEPFRAMYPGAPRHEPLPQDRESARRVQKQPTKEELAECTFTPRTNPFKYADEGYRSAGMNHNNASSATNGGGSQQRIRVQSNSATKRPLSAAAFFEQLRSDYYSGASTTGAAYSTNNARLVSGAAPLQSTRAVNTATSNRAPSLSQQKQQQQQHLRSFSAQSENATVSVGSYSDKWARQVLSTAASDARKNLLASSLMNVRK